jgi:phosphoglycolate phosphatase-like HAD superfamily hydrolase
MNRREFCQTALKLGLFSAASSLFPWRSYAAGLQGAKPQFFILVRVDGGWDTSLSMEPWTAAVRPDVKDFFLEYRPEELLAFNNSFVGPALKPLQDHFSRMTLFNGVFMTATDGGHESAGLYAMTGNGQGDLAVLPLELDGRAYKSQFGTLADKSPYAGQQSKAVWDLRGIVNNGSIGGAELLFDMGDRSTELSNARGAILGNTSRLELFNTYLKQTPQRTEASVIAAAFRAGLTSSAFLGNSEENLDTHSSHEKAHLTELTKTFDGVKALLDTLKNSPGVDANTNVIETNTLLDQTTIMIVSEFTRTPALNGSKGKDHNPQSNSAIVIGPGFKNEIIGASNLVTRALAKSGTPYLAGLPLDLITQQPVRRREDSFIMRPENVVATVAKSMGLDPGTISKGLGSAKILTSVLK